MMTMTEREFSHLRAGLEVMYGGASDADPAAIPDGAMMVKVYGKVEQRRIDDIQVECSAIGGDVSRPPMPYPVHADDEMVIQAVSGETFILKM